MAKRKPQPNKRTTPREEPRDDSHMHCVFTLYGRQTIGGKYQTPASFLATMMRACDYALHERELNNYSIMCGCIDDGCTNVMGEIIDVRDMADYREDLEFSALLRMYPGSGAMGIEIPALIFIASIFRRCGYTVNEHPEYSNVVGFELEDGSVFAHAISHRAA